MTVLYTVSPALPAITGTLGLLAGALAVASVWAALGWPWYAYGWYRTARPTVIGPAVGLMIAGTLLWFTLAAVDTKRAAVAALEDRRFTVTEGVVTKVVAGNDATNRGTHLPRRARFDVRLIEIEGQPFRMGREAGGPVIRFANPAYPPVQQGDTVRIEHDGVVILRVVKMASASSTTS